MLPAIVRVRRLGRPNGVNCPLPLLVTLHSVNAARELINCGPYLRQSHEDWIRKTVFINRDMTPAAAYATFLARKTRRERGHMQGVKVDDKGTLSSRTTTPAGGLLALAPAMTSSIIPSVTAPTMASVPSAAPSFPQQPPSTQSSLPPQQSTRGLAVPSPIQSQFSL